jgi:hypothetical protein
LHFDIPETIHILAVEIVEDRVFSESFSPPIRKKFPEIYNEIKNFLTTRLQEID